MKVRLLPSAVAVVESASPQFLTTFLVDDSIAIDAGSLGLCASIAEQTRIRHVFISHTHADHIASLPIFLDNIYALGETASLYAGEQTLAALQSDLFNNRVWPDVFSMRVADRPFITTHVLEPAVPIAVAGYSITPIEVHHTVPTFGFLVRDATASVLFVMDTGPTEAIWEVANQCDNLRGVFLEVSFPNSMHWLAEQAKHLTPSLFREEIGKLHKLVPVYAVHIKAAYQERVRSELQQLELPHVRVLENGISCDFS